MQTTFKKLALATTFALFVATHAGAGVVSSVTSRAALGANDSLGWGTAADDLSFHASPFVRTSAGGVDVTASTSTGTDFAVLVQGGAAFQANYASGDVVLDTFFNDATISLAFSSDIRGIGFNIASDVYGPFTAFLRFYGAGNVLFDTLSVSGTSSSAGDGTADFLGGISSLRDVRRVDIWVNTASTNDFSINQLSLLTTDPNGNSNLPEPGALVLGLAALGAAALARRRRSVGA